MMLLACCLCFAEYAKRIVMMANKVLGSRDVEVLRHLEHDFDSDASTLRVMIAQLAEVVRHLNMKLINMEKRLEKADDNGTGACACKKA
jgi:hypothetical protein